MSAAKMSDLSATEHHIDEAARLVSRGGDHVQLAIQHLALALKSLVRELNG